MFVYNKATREDFHHENLSSMHCVTSSLFQHSRLKLQSKSSLSVRGYVHATLEEFENRSFTLKAHQLFSVHTTAEKFKNSTITGHFWISVWRKLGQGNHVITMTSPFSNSFGVDGRLNHSNEAAFKNFSRRLNSKCSVWNTAVNLLNKKDRV